jgi:lysophospholipase L1-like esterase
LVGSAAFRARKQWEAQQWIDVHMTAPLFDAKVEAMGRTDLTNASREFSSKESACQQRSPHDGRAARNTKVCAAVLLSVLAGTMTFANTATTYASHRTAVITQAQTVNKTVVMFGDSITQGWSQQAPAFFDGRPYVNKGISGNTTGQMLQRFSTDVLSEAPGVVVILGGINDLASGTDAKTVSTIESNMSAMIDMAKKKRVRVVLASILPVGYVPEGMQVFAAKRAVVNQTIRQLNTRFKKLAATKMVGYVNYYSALTSPAGELLRPYNADNVHITADAYAVMGPLADKAIAAALR